MRRVPQGRQQRKFYVDDVVLRDVAHRAPQLSEVRRRVYPIEGDRTRVRRPDTRHRLQQRRLAGAAAAHYRDKLTRLDHERDIIQDAMTVTNRLGQRARGSIRNPRPKPEADAVTSTVDCLPPPQASVDGSQTATTGPALAATQRRRHAP